MVQQAQYDFIPVVMDLLKGHGVEFGEGYHSVSPAAQKVLLAEAANHGAKTFADNILAHLYDYKADIFVQAAIEGRDDGVLINETRDEQGKPVWHLYHKEVGVVSFHDPENEIADKIRGQKVNFESALQWTGAERQHLAFKVLKDPALLKEVAFKSTPHAMRALKSKQQASTLER